MAHWWLPRKGHNSMSNPETVHVERCERCGGPAFIEQGPAGATYSAPCDCWRYRNPQPERVELSGMARQHLEDIMRGETDGTDPACLGCAAILRALGIDPTTVERKPSAEQRVERLEAALDPAKLRALALELPGPVYDDAIKPILAALPPTTEEQDV